MKELKNKTDFLPLLLTVITGIYFVFDTVSNSSVFSVQQMIGLAFLAVCSLLFAIKLKVGVLALGLFFILTWTGLITISSEHVTYTMGFGDSTFVVSKAHSLLICFTIFHFIVSRKHYFGIGTRKYWQSFISNSTDEDIQI